MLFIEIFLVKIEDFYEYKVFFPLGSAKLQEWTLRHLDLYMYIVKTRLCLETQVG